jgi:type-F conjugative transfer system pilin assembly protein TrbC
VRFNSSLIIALIIGVAGFIFLIPVAKAGDISDINGLLNRADQQQIVVPEIKSNENAEETAAIFNSEAYQKRLQEQINKLKSQLDPDTKASNPTPISRKDNDQNAYLMADERIYLFISSSISISTLKSYAADLDKLRDPNIIMVMRGFVNGVRYMKPTLEFISGIQIKDINCDPMHEKCDAYHVDVFIDPMLFSQYAIQSVPAIVYARGVQLLDTQTAQNSKQNPALEVYTVSGDVSFEHALDVIAKTSKSSQIENILKKLRRGFY